MQGMENESGAIRKVAILGDSGVGKTSLMNRFVSNIFDQSYKATIGADFLTKLVVLETGETVNLQIWDTAGQERYQSLGVAFYKGAEACVLVFDLSNMTSFERLGYWHAEFLEQISLEDSDYESKFPFAIVGNKSDLADARRVTQDVVEDWLSEKGSLRYFETSAKDGRGVEEVFRYIAETLVQLDDGSPRQRYVVGQLQLRDDDDDASDGGDSDNGTGTRRKKECCK